MIVQKNLMMMKVLYVGALEFRLTELVVESFG